MNFERGACLSSTPLQDSSFKYSYRGFFNLRAIVTRHIKALGSSNVPTFGSLEGYIAARIFIYALKHMKGQPTREAIVHALEGLGDLDIGLGEPLHLSPTQHQASHRVWPTILRNGKFVSFHWQDLEKVINQGKP